MHSFIACDSVAMFETRQIAIWSKFSFLLFHFILFGGARVCHAESDNLWTQKIAHEQVIKYVATSDRY